MADEQAMARARMWWSRLDADTQMMFDKLYRIDPENVLAVISDGSLSDLDGATTLDEALTYDSDANEGPNVFADTQAVPAIYVQNGLVIVEPVAPEEHESVTVRWTEHNEGADSTGHLTSVAWLVDGAWVEPVEEVIAGPMAHGESAERSITLPGVAAGDHMIYVTSNADGNVSGSGAVPPAGIGSMTAAQVRVGGGNRRTESPADANWTGLSDAINFFGAAKAAVNDPTSLAQAIQGLYSFAGSLNTGGVADIELDDRLRETAAQRDQQSINVVQRAQALEAIDPGTYESGRPMWDNELDAALEALSRIQNPMDGGEDAYEAVIGIGSESFGLRV